MTSISSNMFLSSIISVFLGVFVTTVSVQAGTFEEALKYANSLRGTAQDTASKFKPEEVFKNQKGGYTDNPPQAGHYQESMRGNSQALREASVIEVVKDEDYKDSKGKPVSTPGKVVTKAFSTREVFKITPESEYVKKGKLIKDNASNVIGGVSNKYIDCEKKKMSACKTVHVDKDCNEEVRTVRRICEKTPKVSVTVKNIIYPDCKNVVVTQHWHTHCPSGYHEFLYSDMLRNVIHDDIRICLKTVNEKEGFECFGGHLVYGIDPHTNNRVQNIGRVTVPKKMHSRLKFSQVFRGALHVTIVDETTGETIHNDVAFTNGQVVELPFSETHDQTFRFDNKSKREGSRWWYNRYDIGVMVLYIDHVAKDRIPNVTWEEVCRDI